MPLPSGLLALTPPPTHADWSVHAQTLPSDEYARQLAARIARFDDWFAANAERVPAGAREQLEDMRAALEPGFTDVTLDWMTYTAATLNLPRRAPAADERQAA